MQLIYGQVGDALSMRHLPTGASFNIDSSKASPSGLDRCMHQGPVYSADAPMARWLLTIKKPVVRNQISQSGWFGQSLAGSTCTLLSREAQQLTRRCEGARCARQTVQSGAPNRRLSWFLSGLTRICCSCTYKTFWGHAPCTNKNPSSSPPAGPLST